MAPKAQKRPVAAEARRASTGSAKRSRDSSCAAITAALSDSDTGLPADVVRMLTAGVEQALRDFKDVRHAYQEEVVAWLFEALQGAQAKLSQKVDDSDAALRKSQEQLQAHESACKDAEERREKASGVSDEAAAACTEAAKEMAARNKALNEAKKAQSRGDAEVQAVSKKKQQLADVIAGVFAELKGDVAKKKSLDSFMKTLKAANADEVLLASVPATFAKPPSERSGFDTLVQTHLEDFLAGRISELTGQIEAGAAGVAERASVVEAAAGAVEQARLAEEAAAARSAEAVSDWQAAEQASKAAAKAKKEFMPSWQEAESAVVAAREDLRAFSEGPMAEFTSLRDRTTPAPEEAEPAPEETLAPASAALEA